MKTLPENVKSYKRTPVFTHETMPPALRKNHMTGKNIWGLIQVQEGELEYVIEEREACRLCPGQNGVIEPATPHNVTPVGKVSFFVEFYKE